MSGALGSSNIENVTGLPKRHNNTYNLRNTEIDLALPKPKKEFGSRCLYYNGAVFWNNQLEVMTVPVFS